MIAAAALDTLPRGMNGELRQLLFFYVGAGKRGGAGGGDCFSMPCTSCQKWGRPASISRRSPTKTPSIFIWLRDVA